MNKLMVGSLLVINLISLPYFYYNSQVLLIEKEQTYLIMKQYNKILSLEKLVKCQEELIEAREAEILAKDRLIRVYRLEII